MFPARITTLTLATLLSVTSAFAQADSNADDDRVTSQLVSKLLTRNPGPVDMGSLEALLKRNPKDFRVHFALARAYELQGLYGMADQEDEICEQAGQPFKNFILSVFQDKVRSLDYDGASSLYRYVAKNFPNENSVLIIGAIALDKQGRLAEAVDNMLKVLEKDPKEVGANALLGALRMKQGQFKEAELCFDRELALRPAFVPAIIGKGRVCELTGKHGSALKLLAPIYRQNPLRMGIAESISDCLIRTNKLELAATPALFGLASTEKYNELQQAKKRVQFLWPKVSKKQRQESLSLLNGYLARENNPERIKYVHFALGDAFQKIKMYDDAKTQFAEGLKSDPDHARAYLHLGEIAQFGEHDYVAAIRFYETALAKTPTNQKAHAEDINMLNVRIARLKQQLAMQRRNDVAGRWKTLTQGTLSIPASPKK